MPCKIREELYTVHGCKKIIEVKYIINNSLRVEFTGVLTPIERLMLRRIRVKKKKI